MTSLPVPFCTADQLLRTVTALRQAVAREGRDLYLSWKPTLERRSFRLSALNLAHSLALRQRDLRDLQIDLMPYGLSSLGRLEGRVLANLDAVIGALRALNGQEDSHYPRPHAFFRGERLLRLHTEALFGPSGKDGREGGRAVHILVTLPPQAAEGPELLTVLLDKGADAVRINCAHDSPEQWSAMIANLRAAEAATGRKARILMDLGGPKCRTGEVRHPADRKRIGLGERLLLTGGAFRPSDDEPFQATCTLPGALDRLRVGDPVFMDDGKIGGTVERIDRVDGAAAALVRITHAPPNGAKLKPDKGINFPETDLGLLALTDKDRADLDFVVHHADMIGYSFVQNGRDVEILQEELAKRRPDDWKSIGLIAKIETPVAVRNLPDIIVQAAARQPFGVMIARGDLAVEIGFERLAEMQEQILWLCEAAHVPVIWATQVLESLVKNGIPTRGDMTDAAMSGRAECVMLNKGPYLADAVGVLDRLLTRMAAH